MMAADRAWMYIPPRDLGLFVTQVKGFLGQAAADMRNRGVTTMWCPCVDCANQKKFAQTDNLLYHLVTRGFTKNYTCWNKHGEEGLNEGEERALNEGEARMMLKVVLMKVKCRN